MPSDFFSRPAVCLISSIVPAHYSFPMSKDLPDSLERFLRGLRRMARKSRAWAVRSPGEFLAMIKALPASLKVFFCGIPRFVSRHRGRPPCSRSFFWLPRFFPRGGRIWKMESPPSASPHESCSKNRTQRSEEAAALYAAACSGSESRLDEHLTALACLEEDGQTVLFEQALAKLFADRTKAEPALRFIAPVVRRHRDAARTRRVYQLAAASPAFADNLTVKNELDYQGALLEMPVDIRAIALRSKANPQDFSFRVTHALALLRAGEKKQALDEFESCEPESMSPRLPRPRRRSSRPC